MQLRLTLPAPKLGGNHERGHVGVMRWSQRKQRMVPGTRTYVRDEAVEYRARVRSIVFAEMRLQGWKAPDATKIDIDYFNIRLDRDNCEKAVNDALIKAGIMYATDYWILDGATRRLLDDGAPRIEVTVTAVKRSDYDFRSKRPARKAAAERPSGGS